VFTRAIWRSLVIFGAALLLTQAAIADPGQWEFTGSLNTERSRHTATLLSDGRVLAAGGTSNSENDLASSELYDPASGAWAVTGHLRTGRNGHTDTLLTNGMVLVAGGEAVGAALAVRNCTIRRAGAGGRRVVSISRATGTVRPC
jgi:hypothetical protein